MKFNSLGKLAAAVACMGMILPPSAMATMPAAGGADVALREGGLLVGQVVDQQGVAKLNAPVSIRMANHEVVKTTTDKNGAFAAKGLRGGQYQLVTEDGVSVCRLWAADTAPPSAGKAVLVVSGGEVVRGQSGGWLDWVRSHPYLTAAVVVTAVAVPVAIVAANEDEDDNS